MQNRRQRHHDERHCKVIAMMASKAVSFFLFVFLSCISSGYCIQCYQCDSNEDTSCPTEEPFDTNVNAMINCNSFEAAVPGQFCMKITQESPGWRGWQKITRRCGSRTDFGVAWGCRWSWDYTGVFTEVCYCETADGCNGVGKLSINYLLALLCCTLAYLYHTW